MDSIFYAIATMITVGFVSTESFVDKYWGLVQMLILSSAFAYSIGSMSIILEAMYRSDEKLK